MYRLCSIFQVHFRCIIFLKFGFTNLRRGGSFYPRDEITAILDSVDRAITLSEKTHTPANRQEQLPSSHRLCAFCNQSLSTLPTATWPQQHQQSATPWETKHSFGSAKYKIITFIHRTLFFLPALQLTHDCTANINRANVWNYSSSLEERSENVTLNIKIKGNFGLLCINLIFFHF